MDFEAGDLLAYMGGHRLAVLSTLGPSGEPQSALVGIAVSRRAEIVFDTVTTSRKHANLRRNPRVALVFSGPLERTLQIEGLARPLAVSGDRDAALREAYYAAWPDGRDRLAWPTLAYWCVTPTWARYSDFDRGPLIATFAFPGGGEPVAS